MPKPEQGRIVLVEIPDPQSRNIKVRPAVIVSRPDEIESEALIACVGVSSAIPDTLPEDCVLLPFNLGGTARTGPRKRSAAICSWLFQITESDITKYIGIVPPKQLQEILACHKKRKDAKDHENRE